MAADPSDFAANNQRYLQAALAWLRAMLIAEARRIAAAEAPASASVPSGVPVPVPVPAPVRVPEPGAAHGGPRWPWRRQAALPAPAIVMGTDGPRPSASHGDALDAATVAEARQALRDAAGAEPAPALVALAGSMALNDFERDMLLLAAAPELDPGMPALIAAANGDAYRPAPTFALGMRLFDSAGWDAMAPGRPLRALQLLEVHQSGSDSLLAAPLRVDERIAAFIKGLNYLDERMDAMVNVIAAPPQLPPSQQASAQQLAYWLAPGGGTETGTGTVLLLGPDIAAKRDVLATAAAAAGVRLLALQASALPTQPQEAERFVHLWRRESMLLPLSILIEGAADTHAHEDGAAPPALPARLLRRIAGAVFVDAQRVDAGWESAAVISIAVPSPSERAALWQSALSARGVSVDDDDQLTRLANEFPLSASRIGALGSGVAPAAGREHPLLQVWNACVEHTAGALDGLAQRIAVRATMDDVALPPYEKRQLQRLVEHAGRRIAVLGDYGFAARANRGLGMAALLHGESGTGKTMAAEAVADALSLALFRIDLSAVVSKYIGETSKNLRRVFDAAESGGAVLLFDEADAVFGKRSEVKDSHDRYANIDINYLLTRMEQFAGVTLLATNMKHALDPAFVRRLRFIIGFPFPGVAERRQIWGKVFPRLDRLDSAHLDLDRLARFALTGGAIFNAALAAAHNAAAAHADIGMPHILDAIRWELQKIGRPVAESEFAWTPPKAAVLVLPVTPAEAPL